jgi:hypothetical protein
MQLLEEMNKMKKLGINQTGFKNLFGFILLLLPIIASAQPLSDEAKITILTCGPAKPLYATFGHTALWVSDPVNNIDEVYNFGTFDSGTSNFYIKFLGGSLQYALSITNFKSFLREYKHEGRWVKGQDLLFSNEQLNALYGSLKLANQPENRYYRYGFFRDNCSTKVIELITDNWEDPSIIDSLNRPANMSYRKGLKHYLNNRPWLQFGINILLGPYADQEISRKQSCFMPDFLMQEIETTGIASSPEILLDGAYKVAYPNEFSTPMAIFWLMLFLLVIIVFWLKTSKKISNGIDLFLFISAAILGLLFLVLWNWSEHVSLHFNFNILWANPLLLVLSWTIPVNKTKFNRIFLMLYALLLFFFLINFNRLPQKIPIEAMPIVSMLVLVAVNRVFQFRKMETKIE